MAARKMEVLPAIDLLGDEAVRLHQGDYDRVTGHGPPVKLAERFAAAGARWIHVVDLDGARRGRLRPELIRELVAAAAPARVQASGGVRRVADALALLGAGAARVVVGTAAFSGDLGSFVDALGDRLVVAIDVRDGVVRTAGWTESSLPVDDAVDVCMRAGVARLLCTAIDRDGTLAGPDVVLVRRVVQASSIPVLAAGGIRSEADLGALARAGAEGAIVGRALLEGRLVSSALSRRA
jgi:phosphoribosylformimino-5-aminoimidazole carboxamide ribotide isomerase